MQLLIFRVTRRMEHRMIDFFNLIGYGVPRAPKWMHLENSIWFWWQNIFFLSFFWVSVNPFCMICTKKSIYIIFPNQIVFFRFFFSFLFNCIVITQMMQKLSTNPWRSRWKNIWKEKCQYLNQFSRLERNEK